nr:tumor suppressor candidate 5 homolog [Danio rerio]|eukprot:XP_009290910.1 tumor suppressor candidate 5 homolog [Danio rerio]
MDHRQNQPETVVMLQPQHPYYPGQTQGPYAQGQHPGQLNVSVQPTSLPEHLCCSIFTMICCCSPLGMAAVVFSILTRYANYAGQKELAEKNSKTARILNYVAVFFGIFIIILVIVFIFLVKSFLEYMNRLRDL